MGKEMTRFEKLNARETYLIHKLRRLQSEYVLKCQPLGEELQNLRAHRDGPGIIQHNGVSYSYIGPKAPYLLPEEKS